MKAIEDALGLAEQCASEVQADRLTDSVWLTRAAADNLWRLSEALRTAYELIESKRKQEGPQPYGPTEYALATVLEMLVILHCRFPNDPAGKPHAPTSTH